MTATHQNPATIQDWLQKALQHHHAGRLEEAGTLYARVRRAAPKHFDAVHLAGTVALQRGRLQEAADTLAAARRLGPRSAVCAMRHGVALNGLGRPVEAEAALRGALALEAGAPEAWIHLGATLRNLGRAGEAIAAWEQAIALAPDSADAHHRLGSFLAGARGHRAAEPSLRRVTELRPDWAPGWSNLGLALVYLGRLSDALACFDRALALDPRLDHAHASRGLALTKCYEPAAAIEAYGRAISCNPGNLEARSARLYQLHYSIDFPADKLFGEHRQFGAAVEKGIRPPRPKFSQRPEPERRLRIGFLSPDLHRHSVAYFLEPLLAHLDRDRFEIYLYHDQPKEDDMSERLRRLADVWRVTAGQTDEVVETLVREDALDLLLDLAGHTGNNRLPLLARRLAPVQATYLGYPNTTGLAAVDYRLVDAVTDPIGSADALATEKLRRFAPVAWSYAPPVDAPEPARLPDSGRAGLAFGCFNNFAKINDETLRAWNRVLEAVPDSRLVLKSQGLGNPILQRGARRRLAAAGFAGERVELLDRTSTLREHLSAYARIDIALDTFPYHGTTTTCEALWMGVPVVTRAGDRHANRVGASLLTAVGHPEWISEGWADYVQKAAALAAEPARLAELRRGLRGEMRGSMLLDHAGQAERFGTALREMWRAECAEWRWAGGADRVRRT